MFYGLSNNSFMSIEKNNYVINITEGCDKDFLLWLIKDKMSDLHLYYVRLLINMMPSISFSKIQLLYFDNFILCIGVSDADVYIMLVDEFVHTMYINKKCGIYTASDVMSFDKLKSYLKTIKDSVGTYSLIYDLNALFYYAPKCDGSNVFRLTKDIG